jgi:hypothetical protein
MKLLPAFLLIGIGSLILQATAHSQGLNREFGMPLWSSSNLWKDSARSAADRLEIRGAANDDVAHFKKELGEKDLVFGTRAYSLEIYSEKGNISRVSIGFINRADVHNEIRRKAEKENKKLSETEVMIELEKIMDRQAPLDFAEVEKKITQRLGHPNVSSESNQKIWDWSGHRFTLERTPSAVTLRLTPSHQAQAGAMDPNRSLAAAAAKGRDRVKRRPNGDVVISGIPPISQGPRGFCVPASWEKLLRFNGLDFDVYELAEKGGTQVTGSMLPLFAAKMTPLLEPRGFKVSIVGKGPPTLDMIRAQIDAGRPLIWGLDSHRFPDWLIRSSKRTTKLPNAPAISPKPGEPAEISPHALLIIGYNTGFQEIALSDSTELGASSPEIWISLNDAKQADLDQDLVVVLPGGTSGAGGAGSSGGAIPPANASNLNKRWY